MTWTLEFRGHPCGPNDRLHWRTRARVTRQWRSMGLLEVRRVGVPPLGRIRISAVFVRPRLGVADEDNDRAKLKPVLDSLRDAGVIRNDTRGYVVWGEVTEERGPKALRVTVEAA